MSSDSLAECTPAAIFDFDGTLADSEELVIAVYNECAERLGVPHMTASEIERLRKLTPFEVLKSLGIPMWKVPRIVHAVRTGMHARMAQLYPFPGVADALRELRARGVRCYILSTNSATNIQSFLTRHNMDVFDKLAGGSSAFGKARYLRRLVKKECLAAGQVFYVGDEVRDITAARDAGLHSVAVTWGYSAREALVSHRPKLLIDRPADLVPRITSMV